MNELIAEEHQICWSECQFIVYVISRRMGKHLIRAKMCHVGCKIGIRQIDFLYKKRGWGWIFCCYFVFQIYKGAIPNIAATSRQVGLSLFFFAISISFTNSLLLFDFCSFLSFHCIINKERYPSRICSFFSLQNHKRTSRALCVFSLLSQDSHICKPATHFVSILTFQGS